MHGAQSRVCGMGNWQHRISSYTATAEHSEKWNVLVSSIVRNSKQDELERNNIVDSFVSCKPRMMLPRHLHME